jgi:predicted DNA-binding antitoxin AbrB/MazE fold protein
MVRLVRAIYENGVFRPLEPLDGLLDRSAVRLRVEEVAADSGRLSDFAGMWKPEEADEIGALIEAEFEQVDPREW